MKYVAPPPGRAEGELNKQGFYGCVYVKKATNKNGSALIYTCGEHVIAVARRKGSDVVEVMPQGRARRNGRGAPLFRSDGKPYTVTRDVRVGGTQEDPVLEAQEEHLHVPLQGRAHTVLRIDPGSYRSATYFYALGEDKAVEIPQRERALLEKSFQRAKKRELDNYWQEYRTLLTSTAASLRARLRTDARPNRGYNRIKGGLSAGKSIKKYDRRQLRAGIKVEMEHTDDPRIATEIAMDHLEEFPDYYIPHLEEMEKRAEKAKRARKNRSVQRDVRGQAKSAKAEGWLVSFSEYDGAEAEHSYEVEAATAIEAVDAASDKLAHGRSFGDIGFLGFVCATHLKSMRSFCWRIAWDKPDRDITRRRTLEGPLLRNPSRHGRDMGLSETLRWVPEAERRGVSKAARGAASDGGFIAAYKKAGTLAKLPPYWKKKRNGFIARHMAQLQNDSRSGAFPSRRELALIMWAYMPPRGLSNVNGRGTARRNSRKSPLSKLIPGQVNLVARRIQQAGGRANLVGGAVIDLLQDRTPKDWDVEVFGLSYNDLVRLFKEYKPQTVGKAFGVTKIVVDGLDIDLSVPRKDNKVGVGHKGFEVEVDPNMTVKEAARRRDFTINAMALDLMTGELHDPFGGKADLGAGILRATDPTLFVQDPLRALRAMQLLARKAKTVDPSTMRLIRSMKHTFPTLAKERLLEEFRKLFLKSKRPSLGLEFLYESEWIEHFPELQALVGLEQHPEWHPEGDVWIHSKAAADAAAGILDQVPENVREALAFGVFLHDVGKAPTTVLPQHIRSGLYPKERLFTAWGHDKAGGPLAQTFLERIGTPKKTAELAVAIVELHMQPWTMYDGGAGSPAYRRLARKIQKAGGDLSLLGYMSYCDACATGKPHRHQTVREHAAARRIFDEHETMQRSPSMLTPRIQGRDLIQAGFKPGVAFKPALAAAFEAQLDRPEASDSELLQIAIDHMVA